MHSGDDFLTIKQLFDLFLVEQQFRNNSDVTINWYTVQLNDFFSWLGSDSSEDLTLQNFKSYAVYLRSFVKRNGCKLSSSSINTAMRAVKCFYNFCIENNYLEDFSRQLRLPKVHKKEQLILDDYEIRIIFESFKHYNNAIELRNHCFIALMLDSGLRRGEISRINVGDVDFRNHTLLVRGKGSKQRIVPLGDVTCSLMSNYISRCLHRSADKPFFLDRSGCRCSDNLVKLVCHRLKQSTGIERMHPHLLRHTFATYYLVDGGDLETLRLILGHSNIQTTQSYLHLAFNVRLQHQKHFSHIDKLSEENRL